MSIGVMFSNSLKGIQAGMSRTAISAGKIAGGIADDPNAAGVMVGLIQGARDSKASLSVLKSADQMLGSLIDIRA